MEYLSSECHWLFMSIPNINDHVCLKFNLIKSSIEGIRNDYNLEHYIISIAHFMVHKL